MERVLGSIDSGRAGPSVVITAGIHGNEPAGTHALRRVFQQLEQNKAPLKGSLLGLAGNLTALTEGQRFVSRDLNRGWLAETIQELCERPAAQGPKFQDVEDQEQRELIEEFAHVVSGSSKPVTFIDIHSTSAGGSPFCCISDTNRSRKLAIALPVPVILGLEENIDGTMLSFLDDLGHRSLVFEGGQHDDPLTVEHDESAIWLALVAAGSLAKRDVPDYRMHRDRLRKAAAGIPHVLEIRYRHPVADEDVFRMKPGYQNFQVIREGEALATDQRGEIHSRQDGRILMPLYQDQGDDGFFVIREVRRIWLWVSRLIRKLRLHVLLPLLPGVEWHPTRPDTLRVNPRVARFFVVQIFHLFGYRKMMPEGQQFVFTRRRPDTGKVVPMPFIINRSR